MTTRRLLVPWLAAGAAAAGLLALAAPGHGKASFASLYGFERTWTCAMRLVRVDHGFTVTEKDEASGYLLFEYRSNESGGKTSPGSLEMVRGREPSDPVQVIVQLPQMPRYHEQVLADGLQRKLRTEYGEPPARRPPPATDGGSPGNPADG